MIFNHSRFQIWNKSQHPYTHSLADFGYANPALPSGTITNVEQAMNWLFAVLYPQTKPAVANVAALPALGNTLNDYRVVEDDGDGKAASYRWEQREGEASPSWHKIYDMDWGVDSILTSFMNQTQDLYVFKNGKNDLDGSGTPVGGIYAGQTIFGGASAGTNLTLFANSGDGMGAATGYVQMGDSVRPTTNGTLSLGTTANRFFKLWTQEAQVGTLAVAGGLITDSSGAISFDNENLSTSGFIVAGTLKIQSGSITDTSGTIDFDNEHLATTGTVFGGVGDFGNIEVSGNLIQATNANGGIQFLRLGTGVFDFVGPLTTLGITATGTVGVTGQFNIDNLRMDGNTLSSTNVNGNLIVDCNGSGIFTVSAPMTAENADFFGPVSINSFDLQVQGPGTSLALWADDLAIWNNRLYAVPPNTNLELEANGTGFIQANSTVKPFGDGSLDLGSAAARWEDLFLSASINDGTNAMTMTTLMSLRDINVGVASGMSIFWNGTKWVASAPDSEVDHGTITGLLDDDHTQYLLLAGRLGGQSVSGGTAASQNLTLDSTAHATKGSVIVGSGLRPSGDNLLDLGTSSFQFKDLYLAGQAYGLRLQNATTAGAPSASAGTIGRVYYNTDEKDVFVDVGGSWRKINAEKFVLNDTTGWDGVATSVTYTVSGSVSDARECIWSIKSNSASFEQLNYKITATQTQVTVSTEIPPPAGNYTIVGIG